MPEPIAETDAVDAQERNCAALVEFAYTSLVDARSAVLLIDGIGRVGPDTVAAITLGERAGRPVLHCPASSALARVASDGCAAVLTVPSAARPDSDDGVTFLGRLQHTATFGTDDERTAILELSPASILVEASTVSTGGASTGGADRPEPQRVDLHRYTLHCRGDARCAQAHTLELDRVVERIRVHTNDHHATALIDAVARLSGAHPDAVAGAGLAALDLAGLVLGWTDETGGHRLPLSFTRRAIDPTSLSRSVREALEGPG